MARRLRLNGLTPEIQHLLSVDHQDGVSIDEVVDLFARPRGMDIAVFDRLVAAGRAQFCGDAVGELLAPIL